MTARRLFAATLVALACTIDLSAAPLNGRVLDEDGRPVPRATIAVSGRSAAPLLVTADDEGRFTLDVPPGRYDVTASAPGLTGNASGVVVDAAGASLEITARLAAVRETLVVSAAQVDQPLSRTPDSVTVLSGADLQARQISTLGAALRTVPGFTVAQNGGPGTLTSLFPRGGESDYTLVLVDGVRMNSFGGGLDLSQVPLEHVDRVEVVRGPQSALYGSDAIGGVVQVITKRGGPPSADGRAEYGSRDTRRFVGSTTGDTGPWRWQAGGDYFEDEGYTGLAPANGERVTNDDARQAQGTAGLGWRHASGSDVQSTFRYVDTERGVPGPYGSDPAGRFEGVDRVSRQYTYRRSAGVRVLQPWFGPASRVRQRVEIDVTDFDLAFDSPFGRSDAGTGRTHVRVQTDGVVSAALGASGGVEWISEDASSTFITANGAGVPIDRRIIGTFGEARWSGHPRLTITGGVRAEHIRREALAGDPAAFQPRPDFPADTVVSVNPKIAGSWLLTSGVPGSADRWTRLRASAGTGIRPPDALEIAFTDNPGLKPERSTSAEVGLTQALEGGAVQLDAVAFFNDYDDLIIAVGRFGTSSPFRTDNISNARSRGVELSGAWRASARLDLRASYTFLSTEVLAVDGAAGEAPPPYRVGDPLLRRPRHQGAIDARWAAGRFGAFGEVLLRGETLDAEPAFGPSGGLYTNPGYGVTNLGASFRLTRTVDVYGRVTNVFDRDYEEVLGFPAPGRLAFIGVRLAASR